MGESLVWTALLAFATWLMLMTPGTPIVPWLPRVAR